MWIRAVNEKLVNTETLVMIYVSEHPDLSKMRDGYYAVIGPTVSGGLALLGEYDSQQRAHEVMLRLITQIADLHMADLNRLTD